MNWRNKKFITSISTLVCLIAFFIGQHGSYSVQMIIGWILAVFFLLFGIMGVFFCKSKWTIVISFVLAFGVIISMISTYIDFNNIKNLYWDYLMVSMTPIMFLLLVFLGYKYAKKAGTKKEILIAKERLIKAILLAGMLEVVIIIGIIKKIME